MPRYWALQDPHTPLSSPDYFLESEPCVDVEDETRQVYCGMLRCIDTSVEALMVSQSQMITPRGLGVSKWRQQS